MRLAHLLLANSTRCSRHNPPTSCPMLVGRYNALSRSLQRCCGGSPALPPVGFTPTPHFPASTQVRNYDTADPRIHETPNLDSDAEFLDAESRFSELMYHLGLIFLFESSSRGVGGGKEKLCVSLLHTYTQTPHTHTRGLWLAYPLRCRGYSFECQ